MYVKNIHSNFCFPLSVWPEEMCVTVKRWNIVAPSSLKCSLIFVKDFTNIYKTQFVYQNGISEHAIHQYQTARDQKFFSFDVSIRINTVACLQNYTCLVQKSTYILNSNYLAFQCDKNINLTRLIYIYNTNQLTRRPFFVCIGPGEIEISTFYHLCFFILLYIFLLNLVCHFWQQFQFRWPFYCSIHM